MGEENYFPRLSQPKGTQSMQCQQTKYVGISSYKPYQQCQNQATTKVWCPTWAFANKGPLHLCDKCAEHFDEKVNQEASKAQIFFGQEADDAFKFIENFIPRNDPRYQNAYGMIQNGTIIKGYFPVGVTQHATAVVDGIAWLVTRNLISDLGDYVQAKQRFPKLFN